MYKLKDNQGQGLFEKLTFKTKEEVRQHLYNFHSNDVQCTGNERLEWFLEIGDWELIEINNN